MLVNTCKTCRCFLLLTDDSDSADMNVGEQTEVCSSYQHASLAFLLRGARDCVDRVSPGNSRNAIKYLHMFGMLTVFHVVLAFFLFI